MLGWLFKRAEPAPEKRSAMAAGYTGQIIQAREAYISGVSGLGELTAVVQSCVSLWEGGLAAADVSGTSCLGRREMAMLGRALALRGEAVFLIGPDRLVPVSDWDLSTRDGEPRAYRLSVAEAGGGRSFTALAGEVLHFRLAADPTAPWAGQAPLRRSSLTAGLMHTLERALAEAYENMPLGSQIVPYPESPDTDLEGMARGFRGQRGRVLLRESVNVTAAGGAAPSTDWRPSDVTPDISKAMTRETLEAARGAICMAFGVLPAMMNGQAQGPLIREAQRHLAGWTLQPLAMTLAEEASAKLGGVVFIDVMRPVQAFDVGGRARALATIIEGLAKAKELGLSPAEVNFALTQVNWGEGDGAA